MTYVFDLGPNLRTLGLVAALVYLIVQWWAYRAIAKTRLR